MSDLEARQALYKNYIEYWSDTPEAQLKRKTMKSSESFKEISAWAKENLKW